MKHLHQIACALAFTLSASAAATSMAMDLDNIAADDPPMFVIEAGQIILDSTNIVKIDDKPEFTGRISLLEQDQFTILEAKRNADGSRNLLLGIESDFSEEPNLLWVNESTLGTAHLQPFDPATETPSMDISSDDADDDLTPIDQLLATDESQLGEPLMSEVAGPGGGRRSHHGHGRRGKGGHHSVTHCLRTVRYTLAKMHICNSNSFGEAAANAYGPIEHQCGMHPVRSSANLPAGSVCILSGGNQLCGRGHHCGDATIKLKNGMWGGVGLRKDPSLRGHGTPRCLAPNRG